VKRILTCILVCLLLCGCSSPTLTLTSAPTVSPSAPAIKEDKASKDDLLPVHVGVDDALYRVYFSDSKPTSRILTEDFVHHYGGKEYAVLKYYREQDVLFFGADYSVKDGRVLCTLYRYSGAHQSVIAEKAVADSISFSSISPGVSFISIADGADTLFVHSLGTATTVGGADACLFFKDGVIYTSNGELYHLKDDKATALGSCKSLLGAFGDGITCEAGESSIKVFFPEDDVSYTVPDVYLEGDWCINGYVISGNKLCYLSANGPIILDDVVRLEPVQGENGVVYSNQKGIFYSLDGKTTPLNVMGHPLSAFRTKGRLLVKTEEWLYDGSSRIGDPFRVRYLEGELYLVYKNDDGLTASIRKLDSAQTLVPNILLNTPFYSIGGMLCYFVRQSFTDDKYALKIGEHTFYNADINKPVYGNSTLDQIIYFNVTCDAVIYIKGEELIFHQGKIYL